MAFQTETITPYVAMTEADEYTIRMDRRRRQITLGDSPSFGTDLCEFVMWCHWHGIRLIALCPKRYRPEFPSDDARKTFRLQWGMAASC